jgi:N-acetyl-alpha-D-glucosaminyl L-malate synthase BshA
VSRPLRIGITCYPSFGGSGIIATELGIELGHRGHDVHFISSAPPQRLIPRGEHVTFHEVTPPGYPLFKDNQYALALSSKMVEVSTQVKLDLLHVHYAIPHATAGYLAKQILGPRAPKLVTTLHGTDITVVGSDPSFLPVTRFSIEQSDGVTAPSRALRNATYEALGVARETEIEVISNFVDTELYRPREGALRPLIVHNSNFRALKRVEDVVRVFAEVRRTRPCELVLIGDGPERPKIEHLVDSLGLSRWVSFLGERLDFVDVLASARVFLLTSETESFGLAALEALSCGVPVVATNVGGLPEVVAEGECGFLAPLGDIASLSAAVGRLLDDDALHARMSAAARTRTERLFRLAPMVDRYEDYYRRVLAR